MSGSFGLGPDERNRPASRGTKKTTSGRPKIGGRSEAPIASVYFPIAECRRKSSAIETIGNLWCSTDDATLASGENRQSITRKALQRRMSERAL